jgi:cysteine desulfuration protein SufE
MHFAHISRLLAPPASASLRPQMTIVEKQQHLMEELSFFQDWQDRYEYVIALGRKLAPLPDSARDTDHLIKGCQSQVWLDADFRDGKVEYFADSDSLITKGMIALFIQVLNQQSPDDILTADLSFIERTGLKEHLAPTRANALSLMATQMKQRALHYSTQDTTPS